MATGDRAEQAVLVAGAGVVEHVLDRAPHGELQRHPDEHGQHDGADDAHHQPAVTGPGDAREDRDEVDELEGELPHDRRHGQPHDEHVGGGERRHGERPATAADEQRGPGEHGERLHRPRLAHVVQGADAAHELEGHQPDDGDHGGEHHVLAAEGRSGSLPRVVGTEVGTHPGPRARAGGPGGAAGRHTDQPRQPPASGPPPAGGCHPSADRGEHLEADVGTQRLGDDDRAVGQLVVLEDGDQPPGGGQGAVERRGDLVAVLALEPGVEPARLEGRAVGGGGELAVAALGGDPRLAVVLARGGAAEVTGRGVDDAVRAARRRRASPSRSRAGARARRPRRRGGSRRTSRSC